MQPFKPSFLCRGSLILLGLGLFGAKSAFADGTLPATPDIPPVAVHYDMPMTGFTAIVIKDKASGRIVRHLVAEVGRDKGAVAEPWDLKDDNGQMVPPGDYIWSGIARPPLKLTYEITVNNAGQPAWWAPAPAKGGGGWMADHSPPHEVCAVGNTMFLGSVVAESGHAMIATDLDGNKLWGRSNALGGFQGVRCYASDGRYAYLFNGAGNLRIDPQDEFKSVPLQLDINYTRALPGIGPGIADYLGGAAARDGKLYLAYNAPSDPWIESSFTGPDVNAMGSLPAIRMLRPKREDYNQRDYDEVMMFHGAFNDGQIPSAINATYGAAPANGPLAGSLTVVFNKPVTVGSLLIADPSVLVYALKPGGKLNDGDAATDAGPDAGAAEPVAQDAFDDATWIPLKSVGQPGMPAIALADPPLQTTALRFKTKRIEYAMVMSRRFEDVAPTAARVVQDGIVTPRGGWKVSRSTDNPITPSTPATMALVWKTPTEMRGVSLIDLEAASYAVDYFTGPADIDPAKALGQPQYWSEATEFMTEMNGTFPTIASVRNIDFGGIVSTRAVRVRATEPVGWRSYMGHTGNIVTTDHHAGFDAVVAYRSLGGDAPQAVDLAQRITEFTLPGDPANGKATVVRHIPLPHPGHLAFSPSGKLYAISAGRIVSVPIDGVGEPASALPADSVEKPAGIAFDAKGLLYVVDDGPDVVKVFDLATGKMVRTIGVPGGHKLGAWDPARLFNPKGIAIDANGKVWVADDDYMPKRVVRFGPDGAVEKVFLGPTTYGGGGNLDPGNRSVLNFSGMKFTIDWPTHTWKLASILYRPGLAPSQHTAMPDRPMYHAGKRFLVGDAQRGEVDVICTERDGIAVPLVTAGNLNDWADLNEHPDLLEKFGHLNRGEYGFVWSDANGDGIPQANEVQVTRLNPLLACYWPSKIGEDFTLNFLGARLRPTGYKPDGTPIYDIAKIEVLPELDGPAWTSADGSTFVVDDKMLAPDGTTKQWVYPDHYPSVHGSHNIGYDRPPGTLVGEHHVVGHFTVGNEELFVTNGNHGDWFAFTKDGLLAGCIFGGPGQLGKRFWTMPEWDPGVTDLSDLNVGEEHFFGSICKAEDGVVYAVAGHNHNSVVRVDGLEKMVRLGGPLTVAKDEVLKTIVWNTRQDSLAQAKEGPKIASMVYNPQPKEIDASFDDWPDGLFLPIITRFDAMKKKVVTDVESAVSYDHDHLYIASRSRRETGILANSADDPSTLFKTGDAVEVDLGLDPAADPHRANPVAGDIRLLISIVKGKPIVEAYRYVVPGTTEAARKWFKSPIGETGVDRVEEPAGANVVIKAADNARGWELEASIPWKSLGVEAPAIGAKLRGDVGLLEGDENGVRTVSRYYWSGKSQTIVSDLAFEARIAPSLWGEFDCVEPDATMRFGPDDAGGAGP